MKSLKLTVPQLKYKIKIQNPQTQIQKYEAGKNME